MTAFSLQFIVQLLELGLSELLSDVGHALCMSLVSIVVCSMYEQSSISVHLHVHVPGLCDSVQQDRLLLAWRLVRRKGMQATAFGLQFQGSKSS